MIRVAAGSFLMGSEDFYPEERPVRRVEIAAFELDVSPVTNLEFAKFVLETGYVTVAERRPFAELATSQNAEVEIPGSIVFQGTPGPVDLRDWRQWWRWVEGANWRQPHGPESDITEKENHPVVQVAYPDAFAYAKWVGKRLPTEAEWEYACRGGLEGAAFSWGEEMPDRLMANTWQGNFPWHNTGARGWFGTSPVGIFEPNGYGFVDMIGNVWEWTSSIWKPQSRADQKSGLAANCGCGSGPKEYSLTSRVLKGGSHLCAPEYCFRYRPAARSEQDEYSSTSHIGFRCAR